METRSRTFLAAVFTCFALCAVGLEFHLDLNYLGQPGSPAVCGVLLCEEKAESLTVDSDGTSLPLTNITSMAIFKHPWPRHVSGKSRDGQGELVASLTSQQPSVKETIGGDRVDGLLEAERATFRLELGRQEDCGAEYTCQVKATDPQGRTLERTSHLLKHPGRPEAHVPDVSLSSGVSLVQLLALVQQIDTKLGLVSRQADSWEDRMHSLERSLENRLEDKIEDVGDKTVALERRLGGKIDSLEKSLQADMKSFQTQIEDKMDDRIAYKLCELDGEISTVGNKSVIAEEVQKGLRDGFVTLEKNFERDQNKIVAMISTLRGKCDNKSNNTQTTFGVSEDQLTCKDLARTIQETFSTVTDFSDNLRSHFVALEGEMQVRFQHLEASINSSAEETVSSVGDLLSNTNSTMDASLGSTNAGTSTSSICEKGMAPLQAQAPFPYPVLQSSAFYGLDFPYLCDTATDGGGWVIIQRRTTGDVDFQREWKSYKKDFGSLDGDFWLGNDRIHAITSSGTYELRIELKDGGKSSFARYSTFAIEDEGDKYTLRLGTYSGTAGNSLAYHHGESFSTYDRDNDVSSNTNCALDHGGGWWFSACDSANLNGQWGGTEPSNVEWETFVQYRSVTYSEMKVRLVSN